MNILTMSGMKSPYFINTRGNTEVEYQQRKLIEDFKILLATPIGSLFGRPSYGSRLQHLLFEPVTEQLGNEIRLEVIRCISDNYDFINLDRVDIAMRDYGIDADIYYKVFNSNLSVKLEFSIHRKEKGNVTVQ